MSVRANCPSCGGEILFKSTVSVFAVCPYCASTVIRTDMNVELLGKMASLPEDMTPFQIGTLGKFEKRDFEIIGRLKLAWSDGAWNEWFLYFGDGAQAWLAEAQGMYMINFPVSSAGALPKCEDLAPGKTFKLNNQIYSVDDIKEATCVGSAGELPFRGAQGRKNTSVDLSGPGHSFACLDYAKGEETQLYVGKYGEFDDFQFKNLREIDGW